MKLILSIAFVLAAAAQAKTLENTKWMLVDLRGGGAVVTDSAKYQAWITLTPAGGHTVSGVGGCNALGGGYSRSGKTGVRISAFTGTQNPCPKQFADEEKAFLAALKKTTRYQISGTVLTLLDGEGAIAKFEAAK
jgi:heat shock protein HslJ